MPTFPVKRPRHRRSIQCTAVQELHYMAGSRAGPARGEHHYLADSDSLCLEALSAGQLYLLLSRLHALLQSQTWARRRGYAASSFTMVSFQCFFLSKYSSTPVTTFVYLQDVSRGYNASVTDVPQRSTIGNLPVIPFSDELGHCARAMTWSCAAATALNLEHVIITVDQTRQSTAKHKKFVGSSHASFKMSCSGWVPSTQLPPS